MISNHSQFGSHFGEFERCSFEALDLFFLTPFTVDFPVESARLKNRHKSGGRTVRLHPVVHLLRLDDIPARMGIKSDIGHIKMTFRIRNGGRTIVGIPKLETFKLKSPFKSFVFPLESCKQFDSPLHGHRLGGNPRLGVQPAVTDN